MAATQDNLNGDVVLSQAKLRIPAIGAARAPQEVARLLTLRQACEEFPVLHAKLIWALAREGFLHPVRPHGRVLYPEWELAELVKRLYRAGSEFGTRAA